MAEQSSSEKLAELREGSTACTQRWPDLQAGLMFFSNTYNPGQMSHFGTLSVSLRIPFHSTINASGFMMQTPRDSWPFFSYAACYQEITNDAGGCQGIIITDGETSGLVELLAKHSVASPLRHTDRFLHICMFPLSLLEDHTDKVSHGFRQLSARIFQIENTLTEMHGNTDPSAFGSLLKELHECNTSYHVLCQRRYFQDQLATALGDFLRHREMNESLIRMNNSTAQLLVEHLEMLQRRSASHDSTIATIPKRLKQQSQAVSGTRVVQLTFE